MTIPPKSETSGVPARGRGRQHPLARAALQVGCAGLGVGLVFGIGLWTHDGAYPPAPVAAAPPMDPTIAAYLARYQLAPPPEELTYYAGYRDGTFSATAEYKAAGTSNRITVELQLVGDQVRSIETTHESPDRTSERYQERFQSVIAQEVVGKHVNEIDVRTLAGATLTAKGFRAAVNSIRAEARTDGAQPVAL